MNLKIEFPIRHIEENIVFSTDEAVWAYYKIGLRDYIYRSPAEKTSVLNEWVRLFRKIEAEMHLLSVPRFFNFSAHEQQLKADIPDGPLKKVGEKYVSQVMKVLQERQKESHTRPGDTAVFLGVKIARSRRQKGLKYHLKDFFRVVHDTAGIEPYPILKEELEAAQVKEEQMFQELRSCIQCERARIEELQYLIAHSAYRGIGEPRIIPNWKPQAHKIQNLVLADYQVEPQFIQVRQFHEGEIREGVMQFLYITDLPEELRRYPGEEWLSWAHSFPFPVDVSIRIQPINNIRAVKQLERRTRKLQNAVGHTRMEGGRQDLLLEKSYQQSAREEKALKEEKDPLLRTTISFCIYADSKEKVFEYTRAFIREYERRSDKTKLVVSPGDQLFTFHEFLPGASIYVKDFTQILKPRMIAGGGMNTSGRLGDGRGMFIGYTGPANMPLDALSRPVFVHQALAAQGGTEVKTKSLAILVVGLTGFGKSFLSSLLAYQSILHLGARVLLFDVKGERGNWVEDLPGLEGHVSLIRIGKDPKYHGMFDPFHIFDPESAKLYAKDFLMQLVQVERSHEWARIIQSTVGEVAERVENPSMSKVLERIREKDLGLYDVINSYRTFPFSQLVFGDKPKNTIRLGNALNIIQIDEMKLPPRNKDPRHYNDREILSVALMVPLTGFARQVIEQDRNFKVVWWEEAWSLMTSDQGKATIDEGIRMGRYWNAETLIVTQNPTDLPDELLNNIGMRFVFRTEIESEAAKALEILGLENTPANREQVKNLREGECLFRDIYGQVGRMRVDVLFKNLEDAFDTTPPLEKERQKGEGLAG